MTATCSSRLEHRLQSTQPLALQARSDESPIQPVDLVWVMLSCRHDLHPATSMLTAQMKQAGVPCAEFNLDVSGATALCDYVFQVTMHTAAKPWKHD